MQLTSFEDLVDYLRNFTTWGDRGGYDFAAMAHLLGACLDNLRRHARSDEVDELSRYLEPHQRDFLHRIGGADGDTTHPMS